MATTRSVDPLPVEPILPVISSAFYPISNYLHQVHPGDDPAVGLLRELLQPIDGATDLKIVAERYTTELDAVGAGTADSQWLYLYPRQALKAAKAAARSHGKHISASTERVAATLGRHGWLAPNPHDPPTTSAVLGGKRRTAWQIPLEVNGSADVVQPHPPSSGQLALREIADDYTVGFLPRYFDRSLSTIEAWLSGSRSMSEPVKDRVFLIHRVIRTIETYRPDQGVRFWLQQPSPTLSILVGSPSTTPLEQIRDGNYSPVLRALTIFLATTS